MCIWAIILLLLKLYCTMVACAEIVKGTLFSHQLAVLLALSCIIYPWLPCHRFLVRIEDGYPPNPYHCW